VWENNSLEKAWIRTGKRVMDQQGKKKKTNAWPCVTAKNKERPIRTRASSREQPSSAQPIRRKGREKALRPISSKTCPWNIANAGRYVVKSVLRGEPPNQQPVRLQGGTTDGLTVGSKKVSELTTTPGLGPVGKKMKKN